MKMEWISVNDALPKHMQEVRVWVENPYFGSFERTENAVWLAFDENFYDSQEQVCLNYVTKWIPLPQPLEQENNKNIS